MTLIAFTTDAGLAGSPFGSSGLFPAVAASDQQAFVFAQQCKRGVLGCFVNLAAKHFTNAVRVGSELLNDVRERHALKFQYPRRNGVLETEPFSLYADCVQNIPCEGVHYGCHEKILSRQSRKLDLVDPFPHEAALFNGGAVSPPRRFLANRRGFQHYQLLSVCKPLIQALVSLLAINALFRIDPYGTIEVNLILLGWVN